MKLKIFTIYINPESGEFDDRAMQEFLVEKELLSVFEHFFVIDGAPTWTLLVTYRDQESFARLLPNKMGARELRDQLPGESRPIFDVLNKWRRERAMRDGVPHYVLLTNKLMAALARARPSTLADLVKVKGIGESKAKSFGEELLALIATVPLLTEEKPLTPQESIDG